MPINIVELDSIETLIKHGTLVIAAGGGGIPVVKKKVTIKASMLLSIKIKQVLY